MVAMVLLEPKKKKKKKVQSNGRKWFLREQFSQALMPF